LAPARPVRDLSCDESFRNAAGKILWTRFEEMMSFRDVALAGEDIEGVHDMRVGSRRLRAALEQFRDVFPKRRFRPMVRGVKVLADALGEVRDLDVMIDRLVTDMKGRSKAQRLVLAEMTAEMDAERQNARRRLHEALESL
jgi:CHAD domain-containing protein